MAHKRHQDRRQYFDELSLTSEKYFVPFIEKAKPITAGQSVLEIGCGEGGNLLPFAQRGCGVTGIDRAEVRISQAKTFFEDEKLAGTFVCGDIFEPDTPFPETGGYDIILIHDVIEHVHHKKELISTAMKFLKKDGIVYVGFPPWRMPFGGHQQIARNKLVSKTPYIHLLPKSAYKSLLRTAGESSAIIDELMDIKECGTSIEMFKKITDLLELKICQEALYFINPHYEIKFRLKPRKLAPPFVAVKHLRDFLTTSYFCLLSR